MIVRVERRETPYVQIDKRPLEDARLSWRAKGILAYLISKPNNWTIQTDDIVKHATEGRDAVRAAMAELRDFGYAKLETSKGLDGKMVGSSWVVFEVSRQPEKPSAGETDRLKNRPPENPPLSKNEGRENNRNNKGTGSATPGDSVVEEKKNKKPRKGSGKATQEELEAFATEQGMPVGDGAHLFYHFEDKGWGNNWQMAFRKWKSAGWLPSQKKSFEPRGKEKHPEFDAEGNYTGWKNSY